jgi:hypothetical protein
MSVIANPDSGWITRRLVRTVNGTVADSWPTVTAAFAASCAVVGAASLGSNTVTYIAFAAVTAVWIAGIVRGCHPGHVVVRGDVVAELNCVARVGGWIAWDIHVKPHVRALDALTELVDAARHAGDITGNTDAVVDAERLAWVAAVRRQAAIHHVPANADEADDDAWREHRRHSDAADVLTDELVALVDQLQLSAALRTVPVAAPDALSRAELVALSRAEQARAELGVDTAAWSELAPDRRFQLDQER